jgi:hypothetical protein
MEGEQCFTPKPFQSMARLAMACHVNQLDVMEGEQSSTPNLSEYGPLNYTPILSHLGSPAFDVKVRFLLFSPLVLFPFTYGHLIWFCLAHSELSSSILTEEASAYFRDRYHNQNKTPDAQLVCGMRSLLCNEV